MFKHHEEMLKPVLDSIQSTEDLIPLGDHSVVKKTWIEEQYNHLYNNIREVTDKDDVVDKAEKILELATDIYSMFLKSAVNIEWKKMTVEQRKKRIEHIQSLPQIEQRTTEWYNHYGKVLTASEFSILFGSPKARQSLVLSKAFPKKEERSFNRLACPTEQMNAMGWGIRFEPIVKQILEHDFGWNIYEAGRITHQTNRMLAASPDGIIVDAKDPTQIGRLIEIKCPYSRSIGGEIPFEYWVQMQIQMEVCNLDECEYIEVEIASPRSGIQSVNLDECRLKGCIALIKDDVEEGMPFSYKYIYGEIGSKKKISVPKGFVLVETIEWGLKEFHRKIVSRDRLWYKSTVSWQDQFWLDVELARKGEAKPVQTKADVCLISDD
jgi:putative phage-type endonuclease